MLRESRMVKAIENYFLRNYDVSRMTMAEATDLRFKRPDLLFIQARRDCLHVIEVESTISRAFSDHHALNNCQSIRGTISG